MKRGRGAARLQAQLLVARLGKIVTIPVTETIMPFWRSGMTCKRPSVAHPQIAVGCLLAAACLAIPAPSARAHELFLNGQQGLNLQDLRGLMSDLNTTRPMLPEIRPPTMVTGRPVAPSVLPTPGPTDPLPPECPGYCMPGITDNLPECSCPSSTPLQ